MNAPVTLTEAAASHIAALLAQNGKSALRIGLKKGGCAGMEYSMEFTDAAEADEEVIEDKGARIIIAPLAQMFLFGMEVDYETGLLESGFKFNNPNVTDACGCGESISFKVDHDQ